LNGPEILDVAIAPENPAAAGAGASPYELRVMHRFGISDRSRAGDKWLVETARWAWRTKIQVHLGIDLRLRLWNAAEREAVRVFAANLRDLLLAAPAGARPTMGLDPGLRTGVKVAVVDRAQVVQGRAAPGAEGLRAMRWFLRIPGGEDPLDASGVHPEAYPVVRRIVQAAKTDVKGLIGNVAVLRALSPKNFVDGVFGLPTVTDILRELEKPGRDPRPAFRAAAFMDGVETLDDLKPGMVLEGAVTNVAAFGAFVDIGVHQDGLVHVSAMSKTFVKDPREVVKPGDIVRVKVLEVDLARKRIALTLRLDDEAGPRADRDARFAPRDDRAPTGSRGQSRGASSARREEGGGALAEALRRAALVEKRK
jgi:transcriptional accessory protein Tex/SPT6